jgi:hypothetical protein
MCGLREALVADLGGIGIECGECVGKVVRWGGEMGIGHYIKEGGNV